MESLAVWAKGALKQKNLTCAFLWTAERTDADAKILIAASNLYRIFAGEKLIGYGPARAAHGYARIDEWSLPSSETPLPITVEVVSYQVNSYYLVEEDPFFACRIFSGGRELATSRDFDCVILTDRVQKVQRYSFQRPFVEDYRMEVCRTALYRRERIVFPAAETEPVPCNRLIARETAYPTLEERSAVPCEHGKFRVDEGHARWVNRSITDIGQTLGGYAYGDLEECVSDEVSRFIYEPAAGNEFSLRAGEYSLFDFGRELSGFFRVRVEAEEDCVLYLVFDEIDWQEERNPDYVRAKNISFYRNECVNIVKWRLKKGSYDLLAFEAYSMRYAKLVLAEGRAKLGTARIVVYENPTAYRFRFRVADAELSDILDAARNTYAQNSVDLLMDCPSRERAGWTNDGYFSSEADQLFSGERRVEYSFLQNLVLAPRLSELPAGMTPMCYPCDHRDGVYVPNCGMWLALNLCQYYRSTGDEGFRAECVPVVEGLVNFFKGFENEDELLENLDGWIFVEWSMANHSDYICGVNYPSNMMYAETLRAAATILQRPALAEKAERIRRKILEQSFNGLFFEDNCVREEGKLVRKGHISETCQYYAFFFNIVTPESHSALYRLLTERFGPERSGTDWPDIDRSNVIIGLCMREDLLMRTGQTERLLRECKDIFLGMARRTGTLWEHTDVEASCNHGISAYCAVWLVNALTGYLGESDGLARFSERFAGIDCEFELPHRGGFVKVRVENGVRHIEGDYVYAEDARENIC